MSMYINTNVAAINAHRNLGFNNTQMGKTMEKLSSGYRINRAADDAAGLAISEKLRFQINGYSQAMRNAQDGISLLQTAEGAMTEIHAMLQRMNTLATQAKNGTYDDKSREMISTEIEQLVEQIDKIANNTKFNEIALLNVDDTSITFQVGFENDNTISATTVDVTTESLEINELDFSDEAGISAAMSAIQAAINTVSEARSKFGAVQNRLEHVINNLGVSVENLSASESRIRNADMAKEMTDFTRNQILVQAGTADAGTSERGSAERAAFAWLIKLYSLNSPIDSIGEFFLFTRVYVLPIIGVEREDHISAKGADIRMNILHNGTVIKQLDHVNRRAVINQLNEVIHHISQQGQVVQTIMIDGNDVTGEMETYIEANYDRINTITVESINPDEMIEEIYSATIEYLQRIHQATETISDAFYGEVTDEAWDMLAQLSEGLNFAVQSLQMIAEHRKEKFSDHVLFDEWVQFVQAVEAQVAEINQAIQNQDTVAIGDMIRYELGSSVSKILAVMKTRVQ